MKKLLLSLLLLLPLLSIAQNEPLDLMQAVPNDKEVRTGTLDCGIKYYIRHNSKDAQRANFHIIYDVGAVQEEDHQNGLAHFLEHMAFNGSKNFPGNGLIDYLQSIGVRFGENLNAMTGQEMTTYMITDVPVTRDGIIDSVMLVLHDWAGFLSLNNSDIDEERGVILEEWRGGQNANTRIRDIQSPFMFGNSIYGRRNVIGNEALLKSFKYEDIKSFYHKWYRPDLQAFVIVGDIDVDKVEAKLVKLMADVKPFDVRTPKTVVVIEDNEKPLISINTDPEMTRTSIQMIFRHEPIPMEYNSMIVKQKMDMISMFVSSMINERLTDISKKENSPFLSANASYFPFIAPMDAFYLSISAKDNETLSAFEAGYTELIRMQRGGFVTSEFERTKAELLSQIESQYKNRNDRRNRQFIQRYMDNFTKNTPYPSADDEYAIDKTLVESITLAEVNAMAKAYVSDKNTSILVGAPSTTTVPSNDEMMASIEKVKVSDIKLFVDDVKTEPLVDQSKIKVGKVIKTAKGKFESTEWTLKNGIKVIVKPTQFKADEVIMSGTVKGGTSTISNLDDLASISFYPYFSQNAGVGNFTQSELNKALAGKIAGAEVGFGELTTSLDGSCAPKDLETMLQLAYLQVTAPRFAQSDLNVIKNQWNSLLPNVIKTPGYIFGDAQLRTMSGNDPRAMVQLPSLALLDQVTLERMEKTYRQLVSNFNGMTIIFTGNFDEAELKPLVEKYIGSLPTGKKASTYGTNEVKTVKGAVVNKFTTPMETPKATVMVTYSGDIKWSLAEKLNLDAIEHILNIRYLKSIREEAGGTYGVGVDVNASKYPRPEYSATIQFATEAAKVEELLPIVYKEIEDLMKYGVTLENLNIFKEFVAKKFAESNISNYTWSGYLTSWYTWDNDNYTDYLKTIDGLTLESVQATAKRAFSQGNCITIVQSPETELLK